MRKTICLVLSLLLAISATACTANQPGTANVTAVPTAPVETAAPASAAVGDASGIDPAVREAIANASSFDEVVPYHKDAVVSEDYATALLCAERMLELEPGSFDAYCALTEARIKLLQQETASLNEMIETGIETLDNPDSYKNVVSGILDGSDLQIRIPFVSDIGSSGQANTAGIPLSNLCSDAAYGSWAGGILTTQAGWIYFAIPNEDWAIYKQKIGEDRRERIGDDGGCYINVIGDWLYYCSMPENGAVYRMRTDGSERTRVGEDNAAFLSVQGDWIYYANQNDNNSLYRMKTDGSERAWMAGGPVRAPYIADGWLYYAMNNQPGLYRMSPDGGETMLLVNDTINYYDICDGWLYYLGDDHGLVIFRMRPDGSEPAEQVLRLAGKGAMFAVLSADRIALAGAIREGDNEKAVVVDVTTQQEVCSADFWCSGLYPVSANLVYFVFGDDNTWHWLDVDSGQSGAMN
ncbi:MAG: DUF5050 domain-containing protein [Clostridiales bacterium]|nr:DUF5050 domain-containing protein [Clostridiales bacterium]